MHPDAEDLTTSGLSHDAKTAFDIAFDDGRYDDAWDILEAHPEVRNERYWEGKTPLMMCALDGIGAMVKWLLANGADPFLQVDNGWNALHFCASSDQPSARCAQYLCKAGLSPLEADTYRETPVEIAIYGGNPTALKVFMREEDVVRFLRRRRRSLTKRLDEAISLNLESGYRAQVRRLRNIEEMLQSFCRKE